MSTLVKLKFIKLWFIISDKCIQAHQYFFFNYFEQGIQILTLFTFDFFGLLGLLRFVKYRKKLNFLYINNNNCQNKKLSLKMDKQNINHVKRPLASSLINQRQLPLKQENKINKLDQISRVVTQQINNNNGCDLFGVILEDPLFKQLNISLEIEAEQQKKKKLLQNFPLRYKNLIHTEALYKKIQIHLKQIQNQSTSSNELANKQKEKLVLKIQELQQELKRKNEQITNLNQNHRLQINEKIQDCNEQIERRRKQNLIKDSVINDLERKVIKLKNQKDNASQYLSEIQEEAQILKKQNQRIVKTLTEKQIEIGTLQGLILKNEQTFNHQKQQSIAEITSIIQKYKFQLNYKSNQIAQLTTVVDALKIRLRKCQDQIIQFLRQRQSMENIHLNEVKVAEDKIFQTLLQKEQIEIQSVMIKKDFQSKIYELQTKIVSLQNKIQNKDIQLKQAQLNQSIQIHQLKQTYKTSDEAHNQLIEMLQEKNRQNSQEKMELQQKMVKLQAQQKSKILFCQQLLEQLQNNKKLTVTLRNEQIKHEKKRQQIQKLVSQFKYQLSSFSEIIQEKQIKIQSYRKQILSLRKQVKDLTIQNQILKDENQRIQTLISIVTCQKLALAHQINNLELKQQQLMSKLEQNQKIMNKQRINIHTQVQIIEGINDKQLVQLEKILKQLERTKLKYTNVVQQLNLYKKQLTQQQQRHQLAIKELQLQNTGLQELINKKMFDGPQIEMIFDEKIKELNSFYEKKIEQEGEKYKTIIESLKGEMTELYKDIDLKKSMQEEMYSEIMRINEESMLLKNSSFL